MAGAPGHSGHLKRGLRLRFFGASAEGAELSAGASVEEDVVVFLALWCERWWVVVFFFGVELDMLELSGAGAASGVAGACCRSGRGQEPGSARASGVANRADATRAALIRGSFIGSPNFSLLEENRLCVRHTQRLRPACLLTRPCNGHESGAASAFFSVMMKLVCNAASVAENYWAPMPRARAPISSLPCRPKHFW